MQQIVQTGRLLRARKNVLQKTPLKSMKVAFRTEGKTDGQSKKNMENVINLKQYIQDELNIAGSVDIIDYEA